MRKIPLKTRKIVAGATFAAALVVLIIPFLVLGIDTATLYLNELLLMATLIVIVPSAILDYENQKWVSSVEKQMPVLVRGVAESQETGVTIVKALEKRNREDLL